MIWLAYLILVLLVFAMIYKLYKEDEREYWRQFDETYKTKK